MMAYWQNVWDRWQFLWDDRGDGVTYFQWMLSAWGYTVAVAATSLVIALVFGIVIGTLRTLSGHRVISAFAAGWVELFRNIPILVQLFIWFFVISELVPGMRSVPGFVLACCALGFFTSARIAEQIRAGIQALPTGQRNAAYAVGFTQFQTYRYVILPQTFRIIIPPLTSEAMNIVKNSSVAFAVSIPELISFAMQTQEETSRGVEVYLAATVLYAVTALVVNRVMAFMERRMRIPGLTVQTQGAH
ncbi:amino acid ABC transporter permease [Phyllobacterium calauticae]|jgi:glutamate/aspartate transport system permease protein|uniref:amino acid ABC transporter permease n=2 Tax=Phyllobacteriaceae TaxID=69277 RepID=UPI001CBAE45B|nr:amino acid ABC transporter permease [Phyllobacterium calauticae]MBZ3695142.1 amino acid ABC transporter permease [Phyllobacterium calauticae]